MKPVMLAVLFVMLSLASAEGQLKRTDNVCAKRVGLYPTDAHHLELPTDQDPRFEIRLCSAGEVQLLGFSARSSRPSLAINTGARWWGLLVHIGNVIILEAQDGVSASTVYIAQFEKGKPVLRAKERTVGGISYSPESGASGDYIVIKIPLKVYRNENSDPEIPVRQYRLRLDEE